MKRNGSGGGDEFQGVGVGANSQTNCRTDPDSDCHHNDRLGKKSRCPGRDFVGRSAKGFLGAGRLVEDIALG
jgi:hypothetical protein